MNAGANEIKMNPAGQPATTRLHSDDKLGSGIGNTISLLIWFAYAPAVQLPIKYIMKKSTTPSIKPAAPSSFTVAAQTDGSFAAAGKSTVSSQKKPPTDLMSPSNKVAASDATKADSEAAGQNPASLVPQTAAEKKRDGGRKVKSSDSSLVKTQFNLKAPTAKAVKLAADFTDWEKSPLDLTKSADGVWQTVIPLSPGDHSYRFIVDGQWHDDPNPGRKHIANPFGTVNAVVHVA
jgi:hypothetical protein